MQAKGRLQPAGGIPERLFVLLLERSLGSCRELPLPFAGWARSHKARSHKRSVEFAGQGRGHLAGRRRRPAAQVAEAVDHGAEQLGGAGGVVQR